MKKFNVPLYLQEDGSKDCGPTCVRMILDYFGIKRELTDLQKKLNYDEMGTTSYDNGSLLLDEGLKTTAITAQPLLFSPDTTPSIKTKNDIFKTIRARAKEEPKDKDILETMKKYLNKGGKLKIEIPSFKHIKEAIDKNQPVLALFYGRAIGRNEGAYHFVVISGYDKNRVFINNPWPPSKRQAWFPVDQFLYGLHTSTSAYPDNGTLIIVSK